MNSILFENRQFYPSKIICVGRNYIDHIRELNNTIPSDMVIFLKPNSAISKDLFFIDKECHFESEISFIIINNKIGGIGFGLDLTKRNLQSKLKKLSLPWERAKAFDKSAIFSNFIQFKDNLEDLGLELKINNTLAQQGAVSSMLYKPNKILSEIKKFMSLESGDIIMSGTPKGVKGFQKRDTFNAKITYKKNTLLKKEWIVK